MDSCQIGNWEEGRVIRISWVKIRLSGLDGSFYISGFRGFNFVQEEWIQNCN